jgi:hypothetical protein
VVQRDEESRDLSSTNTTPDYIPAYIGYRLLLA